MSAQKADRFMSSPMSNPFGTLDKQFDTIPGELVTREPREVIVAPIISEKVDDESLSNDLAVTRETLHRILIKSEDALDDLLHIAKGSEHPRGYEVAGQLIKTVSDVAAQLIDLHKKMKEIQKSSANPREAALNGGSDIGVQNNIVFNGTPQQLLELMAQQREMKDIIDIE
jgi:hypothetical protein